MKNLSFLFVLLFLFSCSSDDSKNTDIDNVIGDDLSGEFNLFPLALNPDFTSISEVNLGEGTLVGLVNFGSTVKVYPYPFLTHNEIVNDEDQGGKYAFSYCPITKSSLAFKRTGIYRASGYLYKDNLTPWDEETESIWSQMLIKGIIGEKEGIHLNTIPVLETTWKTVKNYFPNAQVVSADIFFTKSSPPDDDNGGNSDDANSPDSGSRVYGIVNGSKVDIFQYSDFSDSKTINITIQSQKYIVYGDPGKRVITAFKVSNFDSYSVIEDEFPLVLKHSNGTKYDILGRGTTGVKLERPKNAYVAMWWAWEDFYSNFVFQDQ
jgi:hypothetical protein